MSGGPPGGSEGPEEMSVPHPVPIPSSPKPKMDGEREQAPGRKSTDTVNA